MKFLYTCDSQLNRKSPTPGHEAKLRYSFADRLKQPNLSRLGGTVAPKVISRARCPSPVSSSWHCPGTKSSSHVEGLWGLTFLVPSAPGHDPPRFPVPCGFSRPVSLLSHGLLCTQLSGSSPTEAPERGTRPPVDPQETFWPSADCSQGTHTSRPV